MTTAVRGGTRWRRTGMLLIPALVGLGVLTLMTIQGVLPLNLSISGQDFKLTSNGGPVQIHGLSAYPTQTTMKDGTGTPIVLANVPSADLKQGLCISLVLTFPVLGSNTVQISTTRASNAQKLTIGADSLKLTNALLNAEHSEPGIAGRDGSSLEEGLVVNKNAGDLPDVPNAPQGVLGVEGAGRADIGSLDANAKQAVIAGTVTLNGIALPKVGHGRGAEHGECF